MKIVNIVFSHQFASKVPHTRRLDPDLGQISTRPRSSDRPRPTSTQSRLDLGLPHLPQRATGPLSHLPTPQLPPAAAQSRVPTSPSRRSALRPLQRPPTPSRPPRSRQPISLLTRDRYACRHARIHPTSGSQPVIIMAGSFHFPEGSLEGCRSSCIFRPLGDRWRSAWRRSLQRFRHTTGICTLSVGRSHARGPSVACTRPHRRRSGRPRAASRPHAAPFLSASYPS